MLNVGTIYKYSLLDFYLKAKNTKLKIYLKLIYGDSWKETEKWIEVLEPFLAVIVDLKVVVNQIPVLD